MSEALNIMRSEELHTLWCNVSFRGNWPPIINWKSESISGSVSHAQCHTGNNPECHRVVHVDHLEEFQSSINHNMFDNFRHYVETERNRCIQRTRVQF